MNFNRNRHFSRKELVTLVYLSIYILLGWNCITKQFQRCFHNVPNILKTQNRDITFKLLQWEWPIMRECFHVVVSGKCRVMVEFCFSRNRWYCRMTWQWDVWNTILSQAEGQRKRTNILGVLSEYLYSTVYCGTMQVIYVLLIYIFFVVMYIFLVN